jgi:hypothetical protein
MQMDSTADTDTAYLFNHKMQFQDCSVCYAMLKNYWVSTHKALFLYESKSLG